MPKNRKGLLIQRSKELYGCSRCFFCFKDCTNNETVDHFIPFYYVGNSLGLSNKVLACNECNQDKSKTTSTIAMLKRISQKNGDLKKLSKRKLVKLERKHVKYLGANFIEV